MKVLHVYKTYFPDTVGGCEHVIKTLTKYTAQLGCENTLLTLGTQKEIVTRDIQGLRVIYFPISFKISSCPFNIKLLSEFNKLIADIDLLHFHFPWPFADLLYLLTKKNIPAIVTYHSDVVRQRLLKIFYQPVMKKFLAKVNTIVLTSQNYLDSSTSVKKYRAKCKVIPLALCENDYSQEDNISLDYWRKKIGQGFMLFLGVLRSYKGVDVLLQAIKDTKITLVIAGSGPEEKKLKKISKGLPNVIFLGTVTEEEKIALIKLSRAIILPSSLRSEAFGVCLLEGMYFGKPLISTELQTGTSFVNQNNVTGFVVAPNDPFALKRAIVELYENDDLVLDMGEKARKRYLHYFNAPLMAKEYISCYKDILIVNSKLRVVK